MYNYRKWIKDESRDIAVISAKHPQFCNCAICIAAKLYIKNLVKERVALSKFDSHGRPTGPHRRKTRKFVEDKYFDPNGPFFKILDNRGRELEIERQDLEHQEYLQSIKFLFDNDEDFTVSVEKPDDEKVHIVIADDNENAMFGILGVYCCRI